MANADVGCRPAALTSPPPSQRCDGCLSPKTTRRPTRRYCALPSRRSGRDLRPLLHDAPTSIPVATRSPNVGPCTDPQVRRHLHSRSRPPNKQTRLASANSNTGRSVGIEPDFSRFWVLYRPLIREVLTTICEVFANCRKDAPLKKSRSGHPMYPSRKLITLALPTASLTTINS
jgi:hypothetical protein